MTLNIFLFPEHLIFQNINYKSTRKIIADSNNFILFIKLIRKIHYHQDNRNINTQILSSEKKIN